MRDPLDAPFLPSPKWLVGILSLTALVLLGVGFVELAPADLLLFFGRFHPLVVHLPIGFLAAALLLEGLQRLPRFGDMDRAVAVLLGLGALSALAAVVAGYFLSLSGGYDPATLGWHKWLGIALTAVAIGAFLLKVWPHPIRFRARAYLGALGAVAVLMGVGGHLGGTLTHGPDYLTRYMPFVGEGGVRTAGLLDPEVVTVYDGLIAPVLEASCVGCHGASKIKGDLRLDTPEMIEAGGDGGPVIVAGDAEASELFRRVVLPLDHKEFMPEDGRPLEVGDVELLRWWIDAGASFEQTIGEIEEVPPPVRVVLTRTVMDVTDRPRGIFALEGVEPPPADAVEQASATGALVLPVAAEVPFVQVQAVNVASRFGDDDLAALAPIATHVAWLDLGQTQVTDEGLAVVAEMPHLTRLHLEETAVTDAALQHLDGLGFLEYLNLYGTAVTDASIDRIAALPELRSVYLWQTQVTPEGAGRLRALQPGLDVNMGLTPTPEPTAPDSAATLASLDD